VTLVVPLPTPVTTPELSTVKMPASSLSQEPPEISTDKLMVSPSHTDVNPEIIGTGTTVTVIWSVLVQLFEFVPVTVYVVVVEAVNNAPFVTPLSQE
jgi:hypothetical protein